MKNNFCTGFINIDVFEVGRSVDHARCSHSNIFQSDVYKTNAKLIFFCKISFFYKSQLDFIVLVTRSWLDPGFQDPGYQILAAISWQADLVLLADLGHRSSLFEAISSYL